MGNAYWAGALPGLIMATVLSLAALRLLDRRHVRHILWLVPALHFAGAFLVGPALSLAYARLVIPAAGQSAPISWAAALILAGGMLAALAWLRGGAARAWAAATCAVIPTLAAILVPFSYHLIAG